MLVPFINGRPCWYDGEVSNTLKVGEKQDKGEWRDGKRYGERKVNFEFDASFEIVDFSRGRSSAKLCLIDVNEPEPIGEFQSKFRYEVFLTDSIKVIENSNKRIVKGTWTYTKRGANWGIKLVD